MATRSVVVCTAFLLLLLFLTLSSAVRDGDANTIGNDQSEVDVRGNVGGHVGFNAPGISIGGDIRGSIDISNGGGGCNGYGCDNNNNGCPNCGQYNPPPNCYGCVPEPVPVPVPVPMPMPPYYYNQPLYCVPSSCPTNQCPAVSLQFSEAASTDSIAPSPSDQ